ncbi:MAG TPA: hypothetical protein DEQ61_03910, partial [Streptomyces sp.]|nr:hypothetical protein [Streptomyces sp.]
MSAAGGTVVRSVEDGARGAGEGAECNGCGELAGMAEMRASRVPAWSAEQGVGTVTEAGADAGTGAGIGPDAGTEPGA